MFFHHSYSIFTRSSILPSHCLQLLRAHCSKKLLFLLPNRRNPTPILLQSTPTLHKNQIPPLLLNTHEMMILSPMINPQTSVKFLQQRTIYEQDFTIKKDVSVLPRYKPKSQHFKNKPSNSNNATSTPPPETPDPTLLMLLIITIHKNPSKNSSSINLPT